MPPAPQLCSLHSGWGRIDPIEQELRNSILNVLPLSPAACVKAWAPSISVSWVYVMGIVLLGVNIGLLLMGD